ncbi:MAG TPA: hypothetical protein VMI54_30850 [Polyangiaceae bacterium]|nr:hypothetical protein [Polyangiaceae bacterium]
MRARHVAWKLPARVAWLFLLGGLGGCFSPDLSSAECFACADNGCPGNLVCRSGYCVDPSSPNACSSAGGSGGTTNNGGAGAGESKGTGGTGNVTNGSGGTDTATDGGATDGGVSNEGGASTGGKGGSGTGGSASPVGGSPAGDGLMLDFVPPNLCTGVAETLTLKAHGGAQPYTFSFVGDPAGLELTTNGTSATARGTFNDAGDFPVTARVTDKSGFSVDRMVQIHVAETPVLDTTSLPDVCPDEVYDAALTAHGGDTPDYEFAVDGLDGTGLTVNDNHLGGRFVNQSGAAAHTDAEVTVTNDGCSASADLTLTEKSATDPSCPRLDFGDNLALPPPCAGEAYLASFSVVGGTPGYELTLVSAPDGLALDTGALDLYGPVTSGGTVTIDVKDGSNRTIESDFALAAPRQSCWLAFLAPSTAAQLKLLDPLLGNAYTVPADSSGDPVTDFKFSPNGRLIAYRTGTDPSSESLSILEVSTRRAQHFDFVGVQHYAWSDDSATLAVGFDGDGARYLGGVDTSGDGGSSSTLSFPELDPIQAYVDSDLAWFAGPNLAFFEADDPEVDLVLTSRTSTTFAPLDVPDDGLYLDATTYLRPAPDGVFAMTPPSYVIQYFPSDLGSSIVHNGVLVAPNGLFSARQADDTLSIFEPTTKTGSPLKPNPTPDGSATGCDALVAWAPDGTRLICTHTKASDATQAELVAFILNPATGTVTNSFAVNGSYGLSAGTQTGLSSLFSPSGANFAFATDDAMYSVPIVENTSASLIINYDTTNGGTDAVLAYSPDEQYLLEQRGTLLNLFALDRTNLGGIINAGEAPPPAPTCSDDLQAPEGTFCGEYRQHAAFAWSRDSTMVAVGTADGRLLVKDLRFVRQLAVLTTEATAACGSPCDAGGKFAFQP